MKRLVGLSLVLLSVIFVVGSAQAGLVGPVWPAPGGNSYAFSGDGIGKTSGLTITYTGFDDSAYSSLYWGPDNIGLAMDGAIDYVLEDIVITNWVSENGVQFAVGAGETKIVNASNGYYYAVRTEFRIEAYDLNNTFIPYSLALGTFDVSNAIDETGGFKVKLTAYAKDYGTSGNLVPFDEYYNSFPTTGNQAIIDFSGAFWYNEPVAGVPEPATMLLVASGLIGMAAFRRKLKK